MAILFFFEERPMVMVISAEKISSLIEISVCFCLIFWDPMEIEPSLRNPYFLAKGG